VIDMSVLEDILDEIVSSGGTNIVITAISDDLYEISYTDSNGNTITDRYQVSINDDGSEEWVKVS